VKPIAITFFVLCVSRSSDFLKNTTERHWAHVVSKKWDQWDYTLKIKLTLHVL